MAVQPRRGSSTRKRKRRTHFKLKVPNLIACSNCSTTNKQHRICVSCGTYDGKKVL